MQQEKTLVYRAGLIPYVIENNQPIMMFMIPSNAEYGGPLPQISKGKVEDGETYLETALREAKEEIGLFIGNVILTEEVGMFMGRTTVFITKVKDKTMFGEPSFETDSVVWLTLEQFLEGGRELHKPVIKTVHRQIMNLERL